MSENRPTSVVVNDEVATTRPGHVSTKRNTSGRPWGFIISLLIVATGTSLLLTGFQLSYLAKLWPILFFVAGALGMMWFSTSGRSTGGDKR